MNGGVGFFVAERARYLLHDAVKQDKRWPVVVLYVSEVTEVLIKVYQSSQRTLYLSTNDRRPYLTYNKAQSY
jgi:hypothetical protein